MKQKLATLAFLGLATFALAGCGSTPAKTSEAPKDATKSALSDAAQQALDKAAADVKTAKAKFALWTTADKAYKDALEAAKAGNSDAVIKQATFASDQIARGIAQLSYPSTELK
ncbi:MAG: hypothetical protein Q8O33_10300 [Pseudomonadota bacterium]|nr:hypothetical protein [Pseudomonadota bacterium]